MVFSIPFPSGNSFCNLFIRWSLGLRIEFALFLSGAGDFDPNNNNNNNNNNNKSLLSTLNNKRV